MTQVATLAGLSLRELWISFRLLGGLVAFASGGALVATAPATAWRSLALGVAVAMAVGAGLVAGAVATDRRRGFAGWLVARAVPRSSLLAGWLLAGSLALIVGLAISGISALVLGGLAVMPTHDAALPAALAASAAAAPAAIGVATLAGLVAAPRPAMAATMVLVAGWLVAIVLLVPASVAAPGAGLALLAAPGADAPVTALALRAAGVSLAAGAVVWGAALVVASRADL